MEELSSVSLTVRQNKKEKKILKHVNRLKRNLSKFGINYLEEPSKCVMIGNAGHGTGLQEEQLLRICLPHGPVKGVLIVPGMAYCFVMFADLTAAQHAYHALHGKRNPLSTTPSILYLAYVETVSGIDSVHSFNVTPPGLLLYKDFVTDVEEEMLLDCIDWTDTTCHSGKVLKQRRVKHYGYEFRYDTNNVDKDCPLPEDIPSECNFIWQRLKQRGCDVTEPPNQLTVNHYEPGQGIPPHVDTHSAFEDPIVSLSLGASVVMEFKHPDGKHATVVLPRRSLLVMSGEARYAWSHGIMSRKTDIVPSAAGGLTVQDRSARTSFTFRRIRLGECHCEYQRQCDSYQRRSTVTLESVGINLTAATLESEHVFKVYEEIASHFSETRHKPWPKVLAFVQSLPPGAVFLDVGCGNGKYFGHNTAIFEIGCDTSIGLGLVCRERGFEVLNANCLHLPIMSGFADCCISIAVIHHLASEARRLRAIEEIIRVLRPGGKALIYVWSKDQERGMQKSAYLKQDKRNSGNTSRKYQTVGSVAEQSVLPSEENKIYNTSVEAGQSCAERKRSVEVAVKPPQLLPFPIHINRTQFKHQDVFVPWIMKPSHKTEEQAAPTFYRYYHVFEEGELEKLCRRVDNCIITKSYYDQGNWCVVLEKTCV